MYRTDDKISYLSQDLVQYYFAILHRYAGVFAYESRRRNLTISSSARVSETPIPYIAL